VKPPSKSVWPFQSRGLKKGEAAEVHLAAAQTGILSLGVGPNIRVPYSGVRLLQNNQPNNVDTGGHKLKRALVCYQVGLTGV